MNVKAEAFQEYNQAPSSTNSSADCEVVRALSEPLGKVDKVTIVSTGNGDAAGAYKLTATSRKSPRKCCAVRSALRHADVRPAQQGAPDRRQSAKPEQPAASKS